MIPSAVCRTVDSITLAGDLTVVDTGGSVRTQPTTVDGPIDPGNKQKKGGETLRERFLRKTKLDCYHKAEAAEAANTVTLEDLIAGICSDEFAKPVGQIRGLLVVGDKKAADAHKKNLPAISVSGTVTTGGRRKAVAENRFAHSGLLQIDLDGKDNPGWTVAEMVAALKADPYIQAGFITPSDNGVKGFARIPACIATHKAAFLVAEAHFAARGLVIDPSCKDAVRLCFVSHDPDAWLRKEAARVFEVEPAAVTIVDLPEIDPADTAAAEPLVLAKPAASGGIIIRQTHNELTATDVREILAVIPTRPVYDLWLRIASAVWDAIGEEAGTAALNEWSPEEAPGEYLAKYPQRLTAVKAGTLVYMARQRGWKSSQTAPSVAVANMRLEEMTVSTSVADLTSYDSSDAGNAGRVNAIAKGNIHFVTDTGQWLIWNGCRWAPDRDGQMDRLFLQVMENTAQQAVHMSNHDGGEAIVKYALKCRDRHKVTSGLAMLKSVVGVSISATALDADPWVIGTPNGLIDLRQGCAIAPDKSYLVTKSISCDYDPEATCPLWDEFIATVTGGDLELPRYLQVMVGYALTAEVREQCLFFFYGLGENGKGVFTETIKSLLANYAMTAPESLFTNNRNSSATNDIARLVGCRLATASELDEGASFAESRLKSLTGGDTITARFLHREFFDFDPTHKFWISGNHKPYVRGADHGMWRRLRLIPFTVKIPPEKKGSPSALLALKA